MALGRHILAAISISAAIGAAGQAGAQTSAHAMVVAGRAQHVGGGAFDCATSGPQAHEEAFFNTGVGLPLEGYAYCGLSGGIQNLTGAASTGVAHENTTTSFNMGAATVSADAQASIGSLSVRASGSNTATSYDGGNFAPAEGAAYYSDGVTYAGTGTQLMQFQFSVDGSASVTANSQTLTFFNYQIGGGPVYGAFTADLIGNSFASVRNNTGSGVDPMPGFAVAAGSLSGAGTIYTLITEVTLGAVTPMNLGLYAAAYPSFFGGTANNDFFSTVKLSAINFVDGAGNILATPVSGIGTSGYTYDSTGAHAPAAASTVPEPASWMTMAGGMALVGSAMRSRKRLTSAG